MQTTHCKKLLRRGKKLLVCHSRTQNRRENRFVSRTLAVPDVEEDSPLLRGEHSRVDTKRAHISRGRVLREKKSSSELRGFLL